MKKINNYILEKLHIKKGMKIDKEQSGLYKEILKFLRKEDKDLGDALEEFIDAENIIDFHMHIYMSDWYIRHLIEIRFEEDGFKYGKDYHVLNSSEYEKLRRSFSSSPNLKKIYVSPDSKGANRMIVADGKDILINSWIKDPHDWYMIFLFEDEKI